MLAALSHGLDVIEFLAHARRPVPLKDVAAAIGMSKAGTHRILATLGARGFVVRGEGGVYSLGYKVWEAGWAVSGVDLVPRAAPIMQRLADQIGDGATLGALATGFDMVYLHVIESRQTVRVYVEVGSRLPAHVTATGLACLAFLPTERALAILPPTLKAWTSETITSRDRLMRELERIRKRGYASTLGTFRPDVGGIAAPISSGDGSVVAALCVSSPSYRIDAAWNRRVPKAVMAAAREISATYVPSETGTAESDGATVRSDRRSAVGGSVLPRIGHDHATIS